MDETGNKISVDFQSDGYENTKDYEKKFFRDKEPTRVWCLGLGNLKKSAHTVIRQAILAVTSLGHAACY
jgi:hypothetical protein